MRNPEEFRYSVFWSDEDQAWIGIVEEFPDLSWIADRRDAAEEGIRCLVDRAHPDTTDQ